MGLDVEGNLRVRDERESTTVRTQKIGCGREGESERDATEKGAKKAQTRQDL